MYFLVFCVLRCEGPVFRRLGLLVGRKLSFGPCGVACSPGSLVKNLEQQNNIFPLVGPKRGKKHKIPQAKPGLINVNKLSCSFRWAPNRLGPPTWAAEVAFSDPPLGKLQKPRDHRLPAFGKLCSCGTLGCSVFYLMVFSFYSRCRTFVRLLGGVAVNWLDRSRSYSRIW